MRLLGPSQSIWMYGFPTRKHHYTERALAKRHNVNEKYAELKFVEHHPNPSFPYKTSGCGITCNGSKTLSSSAKNLDKEGITEALPALTTYQLHSGGVVPLSSSVAGRYVTFEDELPAEHHFHDYYGNIAGWYKCESTNRNTDRHAHSSPNVQNISRWNDETDIIASHAPLIRSATRYPDPPSPEPPPTPSPTNSPHAYTKARFEWSKKNATRVTSTETPSSSSIPVSDNRVSSPKAAESRKPSAETLLLKAVKLEDSTVLANILQEGLTEDVNAFDLTGRTALSYLVMKNNVTLVEKLLKTPELDINKSDNEGNTPLHFSAQAGQVEALSLLLNTCSGLEVDARNIFGFTPLMKAALQGRTKCAKLLLFAGASPTMRDTGRGLRAEQWARYCGRYICADVIEKYARNQLLSKTTSYGNWGAEPELGLHFINGRLQPPAIVLRKAINQSYKNTGIKSKLKKAFHHTNPNNWTGNNSRVNSYSLVTHLTSAALCVSSPVLPNSGKVSPVVKSLIKPFVIPRVEITPDPETARRQSEESNDSTSMSGKSDHREDVIAKKGRKLSCFVKLRKKVIS